VYKEQHGCRREVGLLAKGALTRVVASGQQDEGSESRHFLLSTPPSRVLLLSTKRAEREDRM
jgi:hypothetical protein